MMNIFGWRKSFTISETDPTFKVRYLGNVQTSVMKGDGCTDKAVNVIWNTYTRSDHPGVEMKVVITSSGIKAYTKEQGLTEYRAHRISYCIAHPLFPRVFVWVYRHEGRRMKTELRCHAVLCSSDAKAKAMAVRLHEKLSSALKEFQREKLRKQTSRLTMQRSSSLTKTPKSNGTLLPLRTQLLSTANNFRGGAPAAAKNGSNKLGAISEDLEEEEMMRALELERLNDEEEEVVDALTMRRKLMLSKRASADGRLEDSFRHEYSNNNSLMTDHNACASNGCLTEDRRSESLPATPCNSASRNLGLAHNGVVGHGIVPALDLDSTTPTATTSSASATSLSCPSSPLSAACAKLRHLTPDPIINLEVGNDLDELRRDDQVQFCLNEVEGHDSDEESAESGFHDQDALNPDQDLTDVGADSYEDDEEEEEEEREIDDMTVCPFPSLEHAHTNKNSKSSQKTSL